MIRMTEVQFFGMLTMTIIIGLLGTGFFVMYYKHFENMKALEIRQMIVRDSLDNLRN